MQLLYPPTNARLTDQHIEAIGLNNPECTLFGFIYVLSFVFTNVFLMRVFCAEEYSTADY